MRWASLCCVFLALAACVPQEEIEQAIALQHQQDCLSAGFEANSDAYKLCLLLQSTNRQLADVERRLNFIELNQRRIDTFRPAWWD